MKENPSASDAIERRSANDGVAIRGGVGIGLVVGDGEEDVGAARGLTPASGEKRCGKEATAAKVHGCSVFSE